MDHRGLKRKLLWVTAGILLLLVIRTVYVFIAVGGLELKEMIILSRGGGLHDYPIIMEGATDFKYEAVHACDVYRRTLMSVYDVSSKLLPPLDMCLVLSGIPKIDEEVNFAFVVTPLGNPDEDKVTVSSTIEGTGVVEIKTGGNNIFTDTPLRQPTVSEGSLIVKEIKNGKLSATGEGELITSAFFADRNFRRQSIYFFVTTDNKVLIDTVSIDKLRRNYLGLQVLISKKKLREYNYNFK